MHPAGRSPVSALFLVGKFSKDIDAADMMDGFLMLKRQLNFMKKRWLNVNNDYKMNLFIQKFSLENHTSVNYGPLR